MTTDAAVPEDTDLLQRYKVTKASDVDLTSPDNWLAGAVGELSVLVKERGVVQLRTVYNHAQLTALRVAQHQLETRGKIRLLVLKARQIGMSTIIEGVFFTLCMMLDNLKGLILSFENDSSQTILEMTNRYWTTYPFKEMHNDVYNGVKHLTWEHGSGMQISTAKNAKKARSKTVHMLHASEVAFYDKPEELMGPLQATIPSQGVTAIVLESTANGIGNFFHTEAMKAMHGDSDYAFLFFPWQEHPEYTARFLDDSQRAKHALIGELDDEEKALKANFGVTAGQLIWRRWAIANICHGDLDKFHQEFPSTVIEAFVSTGRNVFGLNQLVAHYQPRRGARGILQYTPQGRVEFIANSKGWLTLYAHPSNDKSWGMYVIGADPTHTVTGDFACMQVLNRRTLEQVAVYRSRIDPLTFGKHAQLVGKYFNEGLIAAENEGPGYATVAVIVTDLYPSVYARVDGISAAGHPSDKFGWSTNVKTKELAISWLIRLFGDKLTDVGGETYGLVVHDELTMLELRDYMRKEGGMGFENGAGSEHDDGVMALAIAVAVTSTEPPVPAYEEPMMGRPRPNTVARPIRAESGAQIVHVGTSPMPTDPVELPLPPEDDSKPPLQAPWELWGRTREDDED